MGNNPDELLILTIVIQMHGKVINFDLKPDEASIFDNVRLLCKAGALTDYETTLADEVVLISRLQDYFTHNLDESTYDILKKAKSGVLVDNITYDKSLSIFIGEQNMWDSIDPMTYIQGIYLLSIHKVKGNVKELIYPREIDKSKKVINLLKLSDLRSLSDMCGTTVPNIQDLSTIIPNQNIYIEEENSVKKDNSLSAEEKEKRIQEIRRQFYNNLSYWQLTLTGEKIVSIKLSTLVKLVKTIVGKPCFINLLDYSCNSPTIYIPKEQSNLKQYALQRGDIEMGIDKPYLGGIKKQKRKMKKTKKYKDRNKKNKKNKKTRSHLKKIYIK